MARDLQANREKSWLKELAWHLVPPTAFILVMLLFYPFMNRFQFDADEGFNLMKAVLVNHGYALFSQIWSDQPPLLTYFLAAWMRIFGVNVNAARVLVLVFSAGLVWAVVQYLRMVWGPGPAIIAPVMLILLPYYAQLSVSVMIGLPAIAFAMISLMALTAWHQRHEQLWLVLSALTLGVSVLIKLFTGILVPIFIAGILAEQYTTSRGTFSWGKMIRPALIWGLAFGVFTGGLALILVGIPHLADLIVPHLTASERLAHRRIFTRLDLRYYLDRVQTILILSGIGGLMGLLSRRWLSFYLVAWMGAAYLLLSQNNPVWYHHQLLITVPAAVLGAAAVGESIHLIVRSFRERDFFDARLIVSALALVSFAYVLNVHFQDTIEEFAVQSIFNRNAVQSPGADDPILAEMLQVAPNNRWIVTDEPMYAFRAGMLVPPNLVVFSAKRLESEQLPIREILDTLDEYQPDLVLLGRFDLPELDSYLAQHYRLVLEQSEERLFRRSD